MRQQPAALRVLALARKMGLTEEGFYIALVLTGAMLLAALALDAPPSARGIVEHATALGA